MNPVTFELQPSDQAQPKLLDEDCATTDWPMPPVKVWAPMPRGLTLKERAYELALGRFLA